MWYLDPERIEKGEVVKRVFQGVVAAAVVLSLAATGCSGGGKTVKIGMIAPLTGGLAPFGQGMKKSAQLAIDQAIKANRIPGWKIEFVPEDDAADAKQGANAAEKLASDNQVGAVIGTLNSSVAQAAAPVLDQANIAMISPANSNPSLTKGLNWQSAPKRPHKNYFRDVTTDIFQGQADANYVYNELNKRRAVVMHDKKTYGQGLATIFGQDFTRLGGTVLQTIPVNPGEGDYKSAVTQAKGLNPDMIFFGGEFPEGGVIAKNMGELGLKPPDVILMGGDGMVDKTFVKLAGAAAQGHYATSIGAAASLLPTSKQFVDDYKSAYKAEDYAIYGPSTYDAANIILDALAKVLANKTSVDDATRKAIVAEIQRADHQGALGHTTFDAYGDTTNSILTINKVEGDDFKALKKLTVQ